MRTFPARDQETSDDRETPHAVSLTSDEKSDTVYARHVTTRREIRMERRRLGKTHMDVSVLGFGGSEIGYQRVSRRTVERLLGSALDAGLNVIDTAECYDNSEELIGRAVGARRADYHLFTKCGHGNSWGRAEWRPAALRRASSGA